MVKVKIVGAGGYGGPSISAYAHWVPIDNGVSPRDE